MTNNISNQVKALFITDDIAEMSQIPQSKCLTLQHYHYKCQRSRDDMGNPYGATLTVLLNCSFRNIPDTQMFYERLHDNNPYTYTFIFNATFDEYKNLERYENAMTVKGYIVDIEEQFDSKPMVNGKSDQMLVNVKLLLTRITYKGKTSDKVLSITQ